MYGNYVLQNHREYMPCMWDVYSRCVYPAAGQVLVPMSSKTCIIDTKVGGKMGFVEYCYTYAKTTTQLQANTQTVTG